MNQSSQEVRGDWRHSAEYGQALDHLQRAEWPAAIAILNQLLAAYPDEPALRSLLAETELRAETAGRRPVRGRQLPAVNRRVLYVFVLVMVLLGIGWVAQHMYSTVIAPSIAQSRAEAEQTDLATQAQRALAAGDYDQALKLFEQLAALNPAHPAVAEGIARARQAQELETAYQQAQQQLAAGQLTEAQATLVGIQQIAPTYRDVNTLLTKIGRQQRLVGLQRQAEEAKAAGDWEEVVARLEEVRALTPPTERQQIDAALFEAYMALGTQLVDQSHGQVGQLTRAVEVFGKALALRPQDPEARTQRAWARQYLAGYEAFTDGRWDDSIAQLEPLYAAQPDYLDGQATRFLYEATMRSGEVLLQAGEVALAWERYYKASQMQGVDTTTAKILVERVAGQMTPTPTPTPTATATPTPTATPPATATPTPGYVPLSRYKGKIVYYSTRSGSAELWIMDPDGRKPFRIWNQDAAKKDYEKLRKAEIYSPDGRCYVNNTRPQNENFLQIYTFCNGKTFWLTHWGGNSWDAVWSPKGYWIAYVSNEAGNDEIYLIGADGDHGDRRLTKNEWEWDHHPSWSPDGDRLVFWSNRIVGHKQIWVMNDDGTSQVNLSNNQYEEWDPIWIK
jgi:TolB protein